MPQRKGDTKKGETPRRGRPSLLHPGWNENDGTWEPASKVGRFLAAVRVGNYKNVAAGYAGIDVRTIKVWVSRGHKALAEAEKEHPDETEIDRMDVPEKERPYFDLIHQIGLSEDAGEVDLVTMWRTAARDDWRAAQSLLQHRHRHRWAPTSRLELAGDPENPIDIRLSGVSLKELLKDVAADE